MGWLRQHQGAARDRLPPVGGAAAAPPPPDAVVHVVSRLENRRGRSSAGAAPACGALNCPGAGSRHPAALLLAGSHGASQQLMPCPPAAPVPHRALAANICEAPHRKDSRHWGASPVARAGW